MNDFFKKNLTPFIIVVACLVLLTIFVAASSKQISNPFTPPKVGTPMMDIGESIKEKEISSRADISMSMSNKSISDDAMSYGEFIQVFGEKRIQFDQNCRAAPINASFSVGDTLIFDNRSDKVQAVKFIDDLYALPPYHVRIFKLERQGIFNIDCGSSRNVSEIIVH